MSDFTIRGHTYTYDGASRPLPEGGGVYAGQRLADGSYLSFSRSNDNDITINLVSGDPRNPNIVSAAATGVGEHGLVHVHNAHTHGILSFDQIVARNEELRRITDRIFPQGSARLGGTMSAEALTTRLADAAEIMRTVYAPLRAQDIQAIRSIDLPNGQNIGVITGRDYTRISIANSRGNTTQDVTVMQSNGVIYDDHNAANGEEPMVLDEALGSSLESLARRALGRNGNNFSVSDPQVAEEVGAALRRVVTRVDEAREQGF